MSSALGQSWREARIAEGGVAVAGAALKLLEPLIPPLLPNQVPIHDDPRRMKLWRAGRRAGKSRFALRASLVGHGPGRCFPGIAQGAPIAWIVPAIPQSRAIWHEDILPMLDGVPGVEINRTEKRVSVAGGSTFEVWSADGIATRRGARLGGAVIDEAAHMDLEYVLRKVVRPALADLRGWLVIISTTEIGSYFNELCELTERGQKPADWTSHHGKTSDNPILEPDEIAALYTDYPLGSTDALQELDAELLSEHGEMFTTAMFAHTYDHADADGMTVAGEWIPFHEVRMYVDLASSMKKTADFTFALIAGLTHPVNGRRRAGILHAHNERLTGPKQIVLFGDLIDEWHPTRSKLEATQYQETAVQHLQAAKPNAKIEASYPDKDKRTRAVPWAAAMGRAEVLWPRSAPWLPLVVKQHLKFPNGRPASPRPEDHDESIDCGSMLGADLLNRGGTPKKLTDEEQKPSEAAAASKAQF